MKKTWIQTLAHKRMGIHVLDEYNLLRDIRSKEDLSAFQNTYLAKLLVHAQDQVPYYHALLKNSAIISDGTVDFEQFRKIPFLTKDIIRSNQESLISGDYRSRKFYSNTSGGSTGEPVKFMQDNVYHAWELATNLYYFREILGIDPYAIKKVYLWGSLRDVLSSHSSIKSRIGHWIENIVFLNSFRMTQKDMEQYVAAINSYKPDLIYGYAGSLHELSRFAAKNQLRVHSPGYILSAAETLRDDMRADIEEVFGTRVFNWYGSREVGNLAGECTKGLMHTFDMWNYVEILDDMNQPVQEGEEGKVVVTNLFNYSMPLIRYEIGDLAIRGPAQCACGNILPTLRTVTGRTSDPFILENGTFIYGSFFNQLFFYRDWLQSFQVIQEDYKKLTIVVVPQKEINRQDQSIIEEKIRRVMGNDCEITWEMVDAIPKTTSGKHLYRISHVWRKLHQKPSEKLPGPQDISK